MFRFKFTCVVFLLAISSLGLCKNLENGKTSRSTARIKQYVTINGSEYYIDTDSYLTFDDAKKDCTSRDSRLVTFSSNEKYSELVGWMSANDLAWNWFWTDGYRAVGSSQWVWSNSNSAISYFGWAQNRPQAQSLSESRCITFSYDFNGWDDDSCTIYLPHVCEKC